VADGLASVVIPVFNGERFLGEAIESVLSQTHVPVEVIVVDDESTDSSTEVAAAYEPDGVTLIRHSPNGGAAAARNRGIRAARGAYITTLDSDDLMKPERIERQVDAVEAGAEFVLAQAEKRVEEGVEEPLFTTAKRAPISDGIDNYNTLSWLATREAVERIGLFDETLRWGEDIDYCLRATDAGVRIARLDERLTIRRIHGDNMIYDFAGTRHAQLAAMRRRVMRHREGSSAEPPPPVE
jgi:glycosyltransferase involved in cell wall biosynthesis